MSIMLLTIIKMHDYIQYFISMPPFGRGVNLRSLSPIFTSLRIIAFYYFSSLVIRLNINYVTNSHYHSYLLSMMTEAGVDVLVQ